MPENLKFKKDDLSIKNRFAAPVAISLIWSIKNVLYTYNEFADILNRDFPEDIEKICDNIYRAWEVNKKYRDIFEFMYNEYLVIKNIVYKDLNEEDFGYGF